MSISFFKVSVNPLWPGQKLRPQAEGETRWARHAGAWRTETHTLESFAARICMEGCAVCSALKAPSPSSGSMAVSNDLVWGW